MATCQSCEGDGTIDCPKCYGVGVIYPFHIIGFAVSDCSKCNGTGEISCPTCLGRGVDMKTKG